MYDLAKALFCPSVLVALMGNILVYIWNLVVYGCTVNFLLLSFLFNPGLLITSLDTVRGMMYYRKALMLQAYLERISTGGLDF